MSRSQYLTVNYPRMSKVIPDLIIKFIREEDLLGCQQSEIATRWNMDRPWGEHIMAAEVPFVQS